MFSYDPDINHHSGSQEVWAILGWLTYAWKQWFGEELVVTSLNDGRHSKTSLHYKGNAADIRTRQWYSRAGGGWPKVHRHPRELVEFAQMVRRELGPRGVRVYLHPDNDLDLKRKPAPPHLHVGFAPKAGETFLRRGES